MPWRGRFICPFAVAGLGLRYLRMSFSVMLGHPFRNPRRTALSSVEILGFPNDWCANRTALTRVRTECVNAAIADGIASCASLGTIIWGLIIFGVWAIGNVHKSVDAFRGPTKITFPLYCTSTLSLWNTTTQPALHRGRIPNSDAMARSGMTWPVNGRGNPGTTTSHVCVDRTCRPSGRLTVRGPFAIWRFGTGMPSCMKMDVAPVSAMPCVGSMLTVRGLFASCAR